MFISKLKVVEGAVLTALLIGLGVAGFRDRTVAGQPPQINQVPTAGKVGEIGGDVPRTARGTGKANGTNRTWKEGAVLKGHKDHVLSMAFGTELLVTGGKDGSVRVWDVAKAKEHAVWAGLKDHPINWIRVFANGDEFAIGNNVSGTITAGKISSGLGPGIGHKGLHTLTVGSDGKTWAIRPEEKEKKALKLYTIDLNAEVVGMIGKGEFFEGHADDILAATFSPDNKLLLTGSKDQCARLWDVTTQNEIAAWGGATDAITCVAFSPDGKIAAFGSKDGTVRLRRVQDKDENELAVIRGHKGPVHSIAFSPDGKMLASGGEDKNAIISAVPNGKQIAELKGHAGPVLCVAFSRDGQVLASGGNDKSVRVWRQR